VLIKDKGGPTGQTIDAYLPYVQAYNGSGPMAAGYAERVIADAHAHQGAGTFVLAGCVAAAAGSYVNPFAGEDWVPSRNDQGVDYDPVKVEAIRAIGAGTIVAIGSWGSYGPWFDYRLADGEFACKCIYVAEHIASILSPGTSFNAGDTLATAYPGPDWTEWGWARELDTPSVTWAECGCTEQDNVDPGGRAFARFLRSLVGRNAVRSGDARATLASAATRGDSARAPGRAPGGERGLRRRFYASAADRSGEERQTVRQVAFDAPYRAPGRGNARTAVPVRRLRPTPRTRRGRARAHAHGSPAGSMADRAVPAHQ
jgi:hypothetical protein